MRELELIESLRTALGRGGPRVIRWLGDDAAVVRARPYAVTSLDTMVEGVHFRRRDLRPEEIGHRAIATALSDLAAMAADPGEAYLSLAVPPGTELDGPAVFELPESTVLIPAGWASEVDDTGTIRMSRLR